MLLAAATTSHIKVHHHLFEYVLSYYVLLHTNLCILISEFVFVDFSNSFRHFI